MGQALNPTHRAAAGALVAVVSAAYKAWLAETVAARCCDGLVQQLQAQNTLHVVQLTSHRSSPVNGIVQIRYGTLTPLYLRVPDLTDDAAEQM